MTEVLVTGATGFVGGRLAHQLIDAGYDVRILARTPSKAAELADRGAQVLQGDLTDPESVREAMAGVDGVFHLAAIYELGGDPEFMRQVNVGGTRNILDAAAEQDVHRIVYCGSDTSLGDTAGEVCDETKTHEGDFRSTYAETKYEAHELVDRRAAAGEPIVHAIVSTVYGPGDESPVAELIENHLAGLMVAYLDREAGYTFAHVDDVARALLLAYERGEDGDSYMISGEPASFERFFEVLSELTGIPEPRFQVPDWLVDTVGPLVEKIAPIIGKSGSEVREMLRMGRGVTRYFSNDKTREELGWEPRSLQEGLRDTLPSFQKHEAQAARELLESTCLPLAALAAFDLGLGLTAGLLPGVYNRIIHPRFDREHPDGPRYLVRRTGALWLVFSGVQGVAALDPEERPAWVLASGVLRLLDVPADLAYLVSADDLGWIGRFGLLGAPLFNLGSGAYLTYAGYRGLRARRWANMFDPED